MLSLKTRIIWGVVLCSSLYLACTGNLQQQEDDGLTEGAALLFKNTKTSLTAEEKNFIFGQFPFLLSSDGKQFVIDYDETKEYPFDATVFPADLNGDGPEEIFIHYGNTLTSGNTAQSVALFIKNDSGVFEKNLYFPGMAEIMPTVHKGFRELVIVGPGFSFPVWRWNGKEYAFHRRISDEALRDVETIPAHSAN